jgi:cytochrome c biogenesis protein CcdA
LIYNANFVLPLPIILLMIYFGFSTLLLKRGRQENRKWMSLAMGILMILLGGFLIAYYKLGWVV